MTNDWPNQSTEARQSLGVQRHLAALGKHSLCASRRLWRRFDVVGFVAVMLETSQTNQELYGVVVVAVFYSLNQELLHSQELFLC